MDIKQLYTLIDKSTGNYIDYNSEDLGFTSNFLGFTSRYRDYKIVGRFKDKKFYRRASDLINYIINSKTGTAQFVESKPLSELVGKSVNVVRLGSSFDSSTLEFCLRNLTKDSIIIFNGSNYSEDIKKYTKRNKLIVEFVSEENIYYIIKGKVVKKVVMKAQPAKKVITQTIVNTLASTIDNKIKRDRSNNLT